MNNVWSRVMDATSDVSPFAFLEGPRCNWMPFSHDTDNETQKVSKNELLGPTQVCSCSYFLNNWRNTAASVGLDLDSLALWFCLFTDLVRTLFKMF